MASNGSYETSWADQWDSNEPNHAHQKGTTVTLGRPKGKYSQKMGKGLGKTKVVASRGFIKVKVGASIGVRWIKDKYHKTTTKH